MIARVTRAKMGLANYLKKGHRKDSQYTRTEKDNVIPVYGNLEIFNKAEEYLNKEKNYNDNYLHITISYSAEDVELMNNMSDKEKQFMKKDIVMSYIKHHTSGHDLDNEVIAYAETHQPKIKYEFGKERLEHEHIAIALYNPLNDTKLRTTFHNNSFIDDTLQAYLNKKYKLSQPREHRRVRVADTKMAKDRKYYIAAFKNITSHNELLQYFKDNNLEHREVKTKNNHYYKIIRAGSQDINLRGKGFEHIHSVTLDKSFIYNEHKDIEDLEKVLSTYYNERIKMIDERRSTATKEALSDIYKTNLDDENSLSLTKRLSLTLLETVNKKIDERPTTPTQQLQKENKERAKNRAMNDDISLSMLKQNLKAQIILDYAVDKYKLNGDDYELTADNKINNKNNRQKPKNVIDFLQKEMHLSSSEAIAICRNNYKEQPLSILNTKKEDIGMPTQNIVDDLQINKELEQKKKAKHQIQQPIPPMRM